VGRRVAPFSAAVAASSKQQQQEVQHHDAVKTEIPADATQRS
jgi:hypothetical protein